GHRSGGAGAAVGGVTGGGEGLRVLGIDPGSRLTGWGVVEERGVGLRHVASGTIALGARGAPAARLARLHAECLRLVGRWAPGAVAVERAFVARNVQSALRLGEARGAVLAAVAAAGTALHEYTPAEVKLATVGHGGVGYAVHVSLQTVADLPPAGVPVRLLIHTEVREDAIELIGFLSERERALFHLLRKVKGLGPRTALVVLSGMPLPELAATIAAGDAARLQTIAGVGKKYA